MRTPCEIINMMFRMGTSHLFAYDYETLKLLLADAGFSEIRKLECDNYAHEVFRGMDRTEPWYRTESLYVEALKPGQV